VRLWSEKNTAELPRSYFFPDRPQSEHYFPENRFTRVQITFNPMKNDEEMPTKCRCSLPFYREKIMLRRKFRLGINTIN
jgi:hypothetical protein